MISGSRPLVADAITRARGLRPSSFAFSSEVSSTAAAPSLSGHELPAVTPPPSRKTGWSSASFSTVVPARGPSSLSTVPLSGVSTGDDLAVEEALVARLDGEVLRARGVLVHVLALDAELLGDVLGGLAHRDVDVRRAVVALELRVLGVGQRRLGCWARPGSPTRRRRRCTTSAVPALIVSAAIGSRSRLDAQ